MYLLWRYKKIMPSEYKKMKFGEKRIARAFLEKEFEEKAEENKSLEGKGV